MTILRISIITKKLIILRTQKNGASADNEVNAISSATITSNAVTHGVNAAICCVKYITGGAK